MRKREKTLPAQSELIAWAQLVEIAPISGQRMADMVELGWIEPVRTAEGDYLFTDVDVYRMKKLCRICDDFGLPTVGGTIIVDLLDRITDLENQVRELRRLGYFS
ncbi:chaperone modulator CbpM [Desulfohalovibrio reitneri]|uniref:chaperone modulator CbpM n=1 Tax=Desulfohalovibrio reitneri TaxID=1307759 RepID=UPI0004A6FD52|nr:chaperone modulator CbpM [Desulfohalovibrio reitneri]